MKPTTKIKTDKSTLSSQCSVNKSARVYENKPNEIDEKILENQERIYKLKDTLNSLDAFERTKFLNFIRDNFSARDTIKENQSLNYVEYLINVNKLNEDEFQQVTKYLENIKSTDSKVSNESSVTIQSMKENLCISVVISKKDIKQTDVPLSGKRKADEPKTDPLISLIRNITDKITEDMDIDDMIYWAN